jgi:hypothetical protein
LFPIKLKSKWSGHFKIKEVKPYVAVEIEDSLKNERWVVNGHKLKLYFGGDAERLTTNVNLIEA